MELKARSITKPQSSWLSSKPRLKRWDPRTKIFARVFLWFWFATIVLISSSAWLARQIFFETQVTSLEQSQTEELQFIKKDIELEFNALNAEHLDVLTTDEVETRLSELLFDYSFKNKVFLLAMPRSEDLFQLVLAMPPPITPSQSDLQIMRTLQNVTRVETASASYIGPINVDLNGISFALYQIYPKPMAWLVDANQNSPKLIILLAVLLSGLFCYGLANTIVKPINNLKVAVSEMEHGHLDFRINTNDIGKDELGDLANKFNHMASEIEQQVNNQIQLLADISHELKTPLARQSIAMDLIQQSNDPFLSHVNQQLLVRIQNENNNINSLVQNLLLLSKYDLQNYYHYQVFQLSVLIQGLINDAQLEAGATRLVLKQQISNTLLVNADRQQLSSAIENLIRNALRYAQSRVYIYLNQDENDVVIEVEDDGCGVEPNAIKNIFLPFYRESKARDRNTGGAGLGLAIVKKTVDAHHGKVYALNNNKGGLSVVMKLPISTFVFS